MKVDLTSKEIEAIRFCMGNIMQTGEDLKGFLGGTEIKVSTLRHAWEKVKKIDK